jgi:cellulose synthase/poly-beta-1,6-N-acetylglucosamine synthase-like glycosyltransferase
VEFPYQNSTSTIFEDAHQILASPSSLTLFEARKRALSHFFSIEPFMFPQVAMEEGCPYAYSHFITCNLSIRRSAVLEAGSFDSIYKLSEDTELGLRLHEMGYRVLYHPRAHAWHDHLPYPACNLIRRARVYGADYFYMFKKHPRVMSDWMIPVKLVAMNAGMILTLHQSWIQTRRPLRWSWNSSNERSQPYIGSTSSKPCSRPCRRTSA